MAEREALQKEIEELQNLINDYKTAHGDASASSAQWVPARHGSRRGQGSHYRQPYSAVSRPYVPHSAGTWRKTYSLNNKTAGGQSSHPAQSNPNQHISTTPGAAAAGDNSRLVRSDVLIRKVPDGQTKSKSEASSLHCATPLEKNRVVTASGNRTVLISATGKSDQGHLFNTDQKDCTSLLDQQSDSKKNIKPPLKSPSAKANPKTISPVKQKPATELNVKPCLPTDSLSSRTVIMPAGNRDSSLPPSTSSLQSQASSSLTKPQLKPDSDTSQTRMASSCHKKSRFTWVKKQEIANVSSIPKTEACPTNSSQSPVSASFSATTPARRVSGSNKRASRKPSLSIAVPKTSKYTWVSSSCSSTAVKASASTKVQRKPLSPRSPKVLVKTVQAGLEGPKKLKCTAPSSSISKKTRGGGASASQVGHASRYRWKAAGQSATSSASASTLRSTHKATVYRWTAARSCQKGEKGPTSGLTSSPAHLNLLTTPLSTGAFKLRSRTKIIRRFTGSTPSLERRHSPVVLTLRSRYSLRRRTHAQLKTPSGVRRAQSKVLVSFGRHKLRRLSVTPTSPGTPKSGLPSPSMRSAPPHRVIKTRYKIDTRRAHAIHHSPALSYRVKRVQTARNLLQNRLRTTSERPWRGRGMRWIGGALYRVSANKLSRTNTTCTPNSRAGEWFSPDGSFYCTPGKTSATRYVANRAVQRSLAIIRQARQKKQTTKQYCMYYNRFGKCNHGDACPFIHDPDKVAVCTRFLRGTCKQTDGTCPFSHKVAKEKMPVCSYFLKGICNNSNCPYSHVYVSRKADVCKDFIRGYCPQGDKCKKKHTLVCPEFSSTGVCPRGSKCKLLHRQRAKRSGSISGSGPAKRARTRDASKRSEEGNSPPPESPQAGEGSSRSGSEKLPSFISLSSSPEPPDSTDAPQSSAAETQARGKTLHIKPRF